MSYTFTTRGHTENKDDEREDMRWLHRYSCRIARIRVKINGITYDMNPNYITYDEGGDSVTIHYRKTDAILATLTIDLSKAELQGIWVDLRNEVPTP